VALQKKKRTAAPAGGRLAGPGGRRGGPQAATLHGGLHGCARVGGVWGSWGARAGRGGEEEKCEERRGASRGALALPSLSPSFPLISFFIFHPSVFLR